MLLHSLEKHYVKVFTSFFLFQKGCKLKAFHLVGLKERVFFLGFVSLEAGGPLHSSIVAFTFDQGENNWKAIHAKATAAAENQREPGSD